MLPLADLFLKQNCKRGNTTEQISYLIQDSENIGLNTSLYSLKSASI